MFNGLYVIQEYDRSLHLCNNFALICCMRELKYWQINFPGEFQGYLCYDIGIL